MDDHMNANPRRIGLLALVLAVAGTLAAAGQSEISVADPDPVEPPVFMHDMAEGPTPWTHTRFNDEEHEFTFAVFSDLQGEERERVFAIAMSQLALLRPAFVVNVGDLIDGGTEDRARLEEEWNEFDCKVAAAVAPVFYIGGNHDLTNLTMREFWIERYGARYYHFLYKNVLFLMLDSEDMDDDRLQEVYRARAKAIEVNEREGPEAARGMAYEHMQEALTGNIGAVQSEYFREVIADHPDVRWTFLFMHKPVWRDDDQLQFQAIEAALADRPYTVINGHFHSYSLTRRHGRDYINLGTTSGGQFPQDDMSFDHVTLVTMTASGPSLVNLKLGGILDKSGHIPLDGDDVCFQASRCRDTETAEE
jgi:hypothetical protein